MCCVPACDLKRLRWNIRKTGVPPASPGYKAENYDRNMMLLKNEDELLYNIDNKSGQMSFGEPVLYRWRQQKEGFSINLGKCYLHAYHPLINRLIYKGNIVQRDGATQVQTTDNPHNISKLNQ